MKNSLLLLGAGFFLAVLFVNYFFHPPVLTQTWVFIISYVALSVIFVATAIDAIVNEANHRVIYIAQILGGFLNPLLFIAALTLQTFQADFWWLLAISILNFIAAIIETLFLIATFKTLDFFYVKKRFKMRVRRFIRERIDSFREWQDEKIFLSLALLIVFCLSASAGAVPKRTILATDSVSLARPWGAGDIVYVPGLLAFKESEPPILWFQGLCSVLSDRRGDFENERDSCHYMYLYYKDIEIIICSEQQNSRLITSGSIYIKRSGKEAWSGEIIAGKVKIEQVKKKMRIIFYAVGIEWYAKI